jgi:hypothetical protein
VKTDAFAISGIAMNKSEARNPRQIQNTNSRILKTMKLPAETSAILETASQMQLYCFSHLNYKDLVIVSNFDIRISDFPIFDPT